MAKALSESKRSLISQIVKETIDAYEKHKKTATENRIFYRRKIQRLLESKQTLEIRINQNIQKLKKIEIGIETKTISKDIVCMAQNRLTNEQKIKGRVIYLKTEIAKDTRKIDDLEEALDLVKEHDFFIAIEQRYFYGQDDCEIANSLNCSTKTVRRKRNELLDNMAVKIFGSDAL
jgi:hypothetical protein